MEKETKIINRKATFALIIEKNPTITWDVLNKKSDWFWHDVCDNLGITAKTEDIIIKDEEE